MKHSHVIDQWLLVWDYFSTSFWLLLSSGSFRIVESVYWVMWCVIFCQCPCIPFGFSSFQFSIFRWVFLDEFRFMFLFNIKKKIPKCSPIVPVLFFYSSFGILICRSNPPSSHHQSMPIAQILLILSRNLLVIASGKSFLWHLVTSQFFKQM